MGDEELPEQALSQRRLVRNARRGGRSLWSSIEAVTRVLTDLAWAIDTDERLEPIEDLQARIASELARRTNDAIDDALINWDPVNFDNVRLEPWFNFNWHLEEISIVPRRESEINGLVADMVIMDEAITPEQTEEIYSSVMTWVDLAAAIPANVNYMRVESDNFPSNELQPVITVSNNDVLREAHSGEWIGRITGLRQEWDVISYDVEMDNTIPIAALWPTGADSFLRWDSWRIHSAEFWGMTRRNECQLDHTALARDNPSWKYCPICKMALEENRPRSRDSQRIMGSRWYNNNGWAF